MIFNTSFYENEVRDGFFVSSLMKRNWAATLEVMEQVDEVCRKLNITYFAEFGTLLGAIRHRGFIPWDDDFDIAMKRADYELFLSEAPKFLPAGYSVMNCRSTPQWDDYMTRVVNETSIYLNSDFVSKYHGIPYVTGIDIFPLDYIPKNREQIENMTLSINKISGVLSELDGFEYVDNKNKQLVWEIERKCETKLVSGENIKMHLMRLIESIMASTASKDADEITLFPIFVTNRNYRFSKRCYDYALPISFEGFSLKVPIGYDILLKRKYGNYMKKIRDWNSHNYPVFEAQRKETLKHGVSVWPSFDKMAMYHKSVNTQASDDVVFLPYKASMWKYLEPFYQKEKSAGRNVYVIVLPYYRKKPDQSFGELVYEINDFPAYIDKTPMDAYLLMEHMSGRVYISNPFDEYDAAVSIPPLFYAKNITQFTDELIYVSPYMLDNYSKEDERAFSTFEYMAQNPGVMYSDTVYVSSENTVGMYVDYLTKTCKDTTRNYWEGKIKYSKDLHDAGMLTDISDLSKERRVVVFAVSVSHLYMDGDVYLKKLEDNISTIAECDNELDFLWFQDFSDDDISNLCLGEYFSRVNELMNRLSETVTVYAVKDETIENIAAFADAYYGDSGILADKMVELGKPCMIRT